ncbi:NPC intracellular cholesterol transporter 2 homolog a-like [Vespa crabro]|uniref:NPC intracellular cholesterol transporter 2 homolog a-like n=1 Tax=Vespa crabro TaxID=7445 RepID=UPI001F02DCB9|nr:NPC intracellular cholesterol transporter 2 homolog a-like [Vespa crabro]
MFFMSIKMFTAGQAQIVVIQQEIVFVKFITMALLTFVYILLAFYIGSSVQTEFYKCEGGLPEPNELKIEGCDKLPCSFIKGTDIKAQWDFTVTNDTATLKPKVIVTILGISTEYEYPRPEGCKDLINGECPLEKGELVTYTISMPILESYPNIRLSIEFSLLDENKNTQVCFVIEGKINSKHYG